MFKIRALVPVGAAVVTTALVTLTAPLAGASINPTQIITPNGEAGETAVMNGPGHFTSIQDRFFLRNAVLGLGSTGGIGVQLCNDQSSRAVQLGIQPITSGPHSGQVEAVLGSGTLTEHPGTHTTACNSGGVASANTPLTPDLFIPVGDTVFLKLQEISPGVYEAFAKDVTTNTSASKSFTGLTFPDTASAGVVQSLVGLSAPAVNNLVRMNSIVATDSNGHGASLAGSSHWTANLAHSTANGLSSDPTLVTPVNASFRRLGINIGSEVGP